MNVRATPHFDLLVQGGTVVDGSGGEPFAADVGIVGNRIVAVESLDGASAAQVIDATGKIVAPGFINCHSHSDETVRAVPGADSAVLQGITTEVVCNCGFGPQVFPNLGAFLDDLEAHGCAINLALLAPHGTLRDVAQGDVKVLCRAVDQALDHGCLGVSLGLEYDPGARADEGELLCVAAAVAARDALLTVHLRNEDDQLVAAVEEMLAIARTTGVRLQVSHLKACGPHNWGRAFDALECIESARDEGLRIGFDRYPYTAVMTSITLLLPPQAWWTSDDERNARLRDGAWRPALLRRIVTSGGADRIVLARCGAHPDWTGRSLAEIADELHTAPVQAAERLLRDAGRDGDMVVHSLDEGETGAVLARSDCMVCTDAALRPLNPEPGFHPHPRAFGAMPRFLGQYVRDQGLTALPAAVRQITALPAESFGLDGRGSIARSRFADLVVFDPQTIRDTATFTHPWSAPEGISHVLVNGQLVVCDGRRTQARPGYVL